MNRRDFLRNLITFGAAALVAPHALTLPVPPAAPVVPPVPLKTAADTIAEFTRMKLREDGFYRRILPAIRIENENGPPTWRIQFSNEPSTHEREIQRVCEARGVEYVPPSHPSRAA